MIGVDFDRMCWLMHVLPPVPTCLDKPKEFTVVDIVIPLVLCPDRDTRLDVSAKYLWVQCEFNVSVVQWFSGSDEVSTTK